MSAKDTSTIYELLRTRAERDGSASAIMSPGRAPLTYRDLLCQVDYTVESLRLKGISGRDRIAIVLPAGPELATAFSQLRMWQRRFR